jgi:hypothetical protein
MILRSWLQCHEYRGLLGNIKGYIGHTVWILKNDIWVIHGENLDFDLWAVTLFSVVPVGSYFCCRGICSHKIMDNLLPSTQKTINPNEKDKLLLFILESFHVLVSGPVR